MPNITMKHWTSGKNGKNMLNHDFCPRRLGAPAGLAPVALAKLRFARWSAETTCLDSGARLKRLSDILRTGKEASRSLRPITQASRTGWLGPPLSRAANTFFPLGEDSGSVWRSVA